MTTTLGNVAAALRQRLPGLGGVKLHRLMYFCQGHSLAMRDKPLFDEEITAWDHGPVLPAAWGRERDLPGDPQQLTNAELTVVEYVVVRYGRLTAGDLERLTKAETPWKTADAVRVGGGAVTIRHAWMREFFATDGSPTGGEENVQLEASPASEALAEADRLYEQYYRSEAVDVAEPAASRRGA